MAGTGSISAQFVNIRNMQPISGATVKITGPTSGSATTDAAGKFKVSNLTPGNNYQMDVSATGYVSAHYEDIVVLEGVDTDLYKLALEPND